MRYTYLFLFLLTLTFGCKSDSATSTAINPELQEPVDMEQLEKSIETIDADAVDVEVKMDEPIDQNKLAQKLIVNSKKETVSEEAKVEDRNETKLTGKSEDQKKKEAQMKIESTKEIIDNSLNKGKTCEEILAEQKKLVDNFEGSGDKKIILEMAKKQNDPFFKECLSQESFQQEIDNLATRLEEIMDKM